LLTVYTAAKPESRYTVNKIKNKLFMISSLIAIACVNTLLHHKSGSVSKVGVNLVTPDEEKG